MKIEFLENTGDDLYRNILRIFDFNKSETLALKSVIHETVLNQKRNLEIHSLDYVDSINCNLTIECVGENLGVLRLNQTDFKWKLNSQHCLNVCEMLENSMTSNGFYWLDGEECETEIDLLFSEGGGW